MLEHLWASGPQPPEYRDLILCRDIYHCTPLELAAQPLATVLAHMAAAGTESEVARIKARQGK